MILEDKVIVLKKIKYGEADLILHCLNQEGGRVNFLAKSALKSKKRFGGGVLEPTHYIQVVYKERLGEEPLHFLQDAKIIRDFSGLRGDYERLEAALYFVQLLQKVSQGGEVHSHNSFNLLGNALKLAEVSKNIRTLRVQFEVKFLHYQGVLPPNGNYKPLIERPLKDHEELGLEKYELRQLQKNLHSELEQLLN